MYSNKLGIDVPEILLPNDSINYQKWSTIACDQFSSENRYWESVENFVNDFPSTLKITLPEAYLEKSDKKERIKNINLNINSYLKNSIFKNIGKSFIYVERTFSNKNKPARKGLIVSLDLEKYNFKKKSKSYIRATEETILERIPPRVEIRKNSAIELPHILILINDKKKKIIESIEKDQEKFETLYDFDLMLNQGHIKGKKIYDINYINKIIKNFETLQEATDKSNPLIFAVGDGNHSLATAKTIWENKKKSLTKNEKKNHPARFALVEINNIYDKGIEFMPIHRVIFDSNLDDFIIFLKKRAKIEVIEKNLTEDSLKKFEVSTDKNRSFYLFNNKKSFLINFTTTENKISTTLLQPLIDKFLKTAKGKIDYIHGVESTLELGTTENCFGIILPNFDKQLFFETILKDRAFPRKTFSMGEATEKRFYLEAKKIID